MKIIFLILIVLSSALAFANPYSLIETESPYILRPMELEVGMLTGYETGHIPDCFAKPHLGLGLFSWLQIGGSFSYIYFHNQDDWRLAEYEAIAKARLLHFKKRDFSLFAYFRYRKALGDPIITAYRGNLNQVIAVVSHRADQGRDYIGGLTGRFLLYNFNKSFFINNIGLMLGVDYARTEGRDYFAVAFPEEDDYRKRISCSVAPALFFGPTRRTRGWRSPNPFQVKNAVTFAVDNKFTYWFELGHMYDVVPQVTWSLSKKTSVHGGVSVPVLGGKVYKVYAGIKTRIDLDWITANIDLGPTLFSPDGDGVNDIMVFKPSSSSRYKIKRWRIVIYDPSGKPFRIISKSGKPPRRVRWNGKNKKDQYVESAQRYKVKLEVFDEHNNMDRAWTHFNTDILFHKGTSRIILFGFNSSRIKGKYARIMDKLASLMLTRYSRYNLTIYGHTCEIGKDKRNARLSELRARAIFGYLVSKGVSARRISYKGYADTKPIADNKTVTGRRQNRRADFILKRK